MVSPPLLFTLLIAAISPTLPAQQAATSRQQDLEARAAATGYAFTAMATFQQSLRLRCGLLPGEAGVQSQAAFQIWMDRNDPTMRLAARYLHSMMQMVDQAQGAAAAQRFGQDRISESTENASRANAPLFPDGIAHEATCLDIARLAASGEADILRHQEFGPTFSRMATDND